MPPHAPDSSYSLDVPIIQFSLVVQVYDFLGFCRPAEESSTLCTDYAPYQTVVSWTHVFGGNMILGISCGSAEESAPVYINLD